MMVELLFSTRWILLHTVISIDFFALAFCVFLCVIILAAVWSMQRLFVALFSILDITLALTQ